MAKSHNRNPEQLALQKENYKALRAAGFSTQEASRLRSASPAKVAAALRTGQRPAPISQRAAAAGRHEKFQPKEVIPYEVHKGRIKASDYQKMGEGQAKMYYSRYAYLVTYELKFKDKPNERKYATITSHEKMNKKELREEVIAICEDQADGEYPGDLVKGSIQLIQAYYRSDM